MPHFYFHLRTTSGIERDTEGITFPSLEQAQSDAETSLLEMMADEMAAGRRTNLLGIDITDGRGKIFAAVNAGNPGV